MSKAKIALFGPQLKTKDAFYGGGTGGSVRNMNMYLTHFNSNDFELIPVFHTVRKRKKSFSNLFFSRIIIDSLRLLKTLVFTKPVLVHVFAQYRTAIYREFVVYLILTLFRKPFIYHIKAGVFIDWYLSSGYLKKWMTGRIIKNSKKVFCEGQPYVPFLKTTFSRESHYLPNFVPKSEIPKNLIARDNSGPLRLVFVGYCYEGKGVFELIEGCVQAAKKGVEIQLNLIGEMHPDFTKFLATVSLPDSLDIIKHGRKTNAEVLSMYESFNIFILPSKHIGEGHNNSINEAMMYGLCILCTRHGFLETVLNETCALFIENNLTDSIANHLKNLNDNRSLIQKLGRNSYDHILTHYSSSTYFPKLDQYYTSIIKKLQSLKS